MEPEVASDAITPAEAVPASEWARRRLRMDITITLCWLVTLASWVYGAFGGTNAIISQMWFVALSAGVALVANYHWAATKDDGNRMAAITQLFKDVK